MRFPRGNGFARGLLFSIFVSSISLCASLEANAQAADLNTLSLNLHGYHPMAEGRRYLESRNGKIRETTSQLHYFTYPELERGLEFQLKSLSGKIASLESDELPHVIFLQEVGAGLPNSRKNCDEFLDQKREDGFGKNTALRLQQRLSDRGVRYSAALACRGNVGWFTTQQSFANERIVARDKRRSSKFRVVFDFGSNPYPNGFLVEGTALLIRDPWRIIEHTAGHFGVPGTGETYFLQFARIQKSGSSGWYLIANLHGNHKVRHFEQAVAMRKMLGDFVLNHRDRRNYRGTLVGGDFNAHFYRPLSLGGEISSLPWEISFPGEFTYDPQSSDADFAEVESKLWKLNIDSNFKDWAGLGDTPQARARVHRAVEEFANLARSQVAEKIRFTEKLDEALTQKRCSAPKSLEPDCAFR